MGFSTPGVLNLALRVLNLLIRVLNLVPGTQYPVLYRENPIENFPLKNPAHVKSLPPPLFPPDSGFWEDPHQLHVVYFRLSNPIPPKISKRVIFSGDCRQYMGLQSVITIIGKTSKLFALQASPYKGSKPRVNLNRFIFSIACRLSLK